MHWEFMGTAEDARDLTERARNEFGGDELTPEEKAAEAAHDIPRRAYQAAQARRG